MKLHRLAFLAAALLAAACQPRKADPHTTVAITPFLGAPVMGDKAAPVEIIEYASTTCPHCKAFHESEFKVLKSKYLDTGKAKLVWLLMPTPPEGVAAAGIAIARCAGEAKFFEVLDDLFASQDKLYDAARVPWDLQQALIALGARHGLSADQVGTCIDDKSIQAVVVKDMKEAPAFVTGTPTFIIDREEVKDESPPGLEAAIDAAVAKTQPPKPDPLAPKQP